MINNIIIPLTQWDSRWMNTIVVTSTIGRIGCTITALSILTGNSVHFDDPNAVNTICDFTNLNHKLGPNLIIWESIKKLQGVAGYERIWDNSHIDKIKKAIDDGHGVLIECENGAHWVACMKYGAGWDCVDPRTGQARILTIAECTGYCIVYLNKTTVISSGPSAVDATIARIQGMNYADEEDKRILVEEGYLKNDGNVVAKYLHIVEQQQAEGILKQMQQENIPPVFETEKNELVEAIDNLAEKKEVKPMSAEPVEPDNSGRPFGISKKLIMSVGSLIGLPVEYLALMQFLPEEITVQPEYVLPMIYSTAAVVIMYLIGQTIIDLKKLKQ